MTPLLGTSRHPRRPLIPAVALLALLPAGRLLAQDEPQPVTLFLKGLHTGLCVEFLVSPAALREHIGGAVAPVAVESLSSSYPALARVAAAEAEYQGWAPAEYCWFLYREGVVSGRAVNKDDGRQPVAIGYLSVATRRGGGEVERTVITFFTNTGRVAGALDRGRYRVEEIDLSLSLIPGEEESAGRRYTARHGKTTVQWDGRPGDPRPSEERGIVLTGRTKGGDLHPIRTTIRPDSVFTASGSLKVSGEGELQRLISASPIRLVTSFLRGGDADWEFGR